MKVNSLPFLALLLGAVCAGLSGCGKKTAAPVPQDIRPVRAEQMGAHEVSSVNSYSGEVRARFQTDLAFRVGGKITARQVEVGTQVKAGQLIATIDPQDYALAASAANSQLAAARAEALLAQQDLKRYTELRAQNFISQAELDRRRTSADSAAAKVRQVGADATRQGNQREYTRLNAPHAGVITRVNAEPGQVVAAGQAVAQVARTGEMEAAINVPENELDRVRQAKSLSIRLWSAQGKAYAGKLRELSPVADAATRTYSARIAFQKPDDDVKLGMTATVDVATNGVENLSVAQAALFEVNGHPQVWVVDPKTGQVAARAVQLGSLIGERGAIVSGLRAGEWVVTAGVHKISPGQRVRLVRSAQPS